MKVLFSHYGIIDGEGFGRSLPIAKGLSDLGYDVTLITSQAKGFKFPYRKEKRGKLLIVSFPDILPKSFRKAGFGILNIILKSAYALFKRFDIVHSDCGHRPSSGLPCIINRFFYKSIYISEWWDFIGKGGLYDNMPKFRRLFLGNYDNWAEIQNKKVANGVIALSEFTKNRALEIGIKSERISVIHGGSDLENIKYFANTNFREKFGIDRDCLLFGFIGANEGEINDIAPFIKAVQSLNKCHNVKWFTTGSKLSQETLMKYNIQDDLYDFGWVSYSELPELMSCADLFLLIQKSNLYNQARFPNKLGDYLAAGRLIMTNGFGEIDHYVRSYPECFVKVDWNPDAVADAICILLTQKGDLVQKGARCREVAEKYNSWTLRAAQVKEFYIKVLAGFSKKGKPAGKVKVMYSHFGVEGKGGWGRSFYMAKAMAKLGHEVVFLTNRPEFSLFFCKVKTIKNVKVICFPDFLPTAVKSKGFGSIGLFYKLIYSLFNKFDIVIADCGHRPSGMPCRLNRLVFKSKYLSEWWDYFGVEGYYRQKTPLFRLLYGSIEKWAEVHDKQIADGVIVLSTFMRDRALGFQIRNIAIVQGGALVDELVAYPFNNEPDHKLTFGYFGMSNSEVIQVEPFLQAIADPRFKNRIQLFSYGSYLDKKLIQKYGLEDVIIEKGWLDYLTSADGLKDIDVYVHIHEDKVTTRAGWPNKVGDYLALGRPVMISPYGDLAEFISKQPDGFIPVGFNTESISNQISSLIDGQYNFRLMGESNRKLSETISWEIKAEQIINFYFELVSQRTAAGKE